MKKMNFEKERKKGAFKSETPETNDSHGSQ